ncbi:MAG: hypothetical protein AAGJ46_17825 [Planctomycetota bacterium]
MKPLDLYTGAGRIRHGLEELTLAFEASADGWDDSVREKFYEERIEPILPIVKNALDAVGRMQQLLSEAQRDMQQ